MISKDEAEKKKEEAIKTLRKEWDLLKMTGLLSQIGCTAGPKMIRREGIKKPTYDMFEWKAMIRGPKKTPYDGYLFEFEIKYPENYPESPPKVICKTKIYHMNINNDGNVCVSSTKKRPLEPNENEKKTSYWEDAGDISTVLLSIFRILAKPNADDPYISNLAELYINNRQEYEKNVREYCQKYAKKIS